MQAKASDNRGKRSENQTFLTLRILLYLWYKSFNISIYHASFRPTTIEYFYHTPVYKEEQIPPCWDNFENLPPSTRPQRVVSAGIFRFRLSLLDETPLSPVTHRTGLECTLCIWFVPWCNNSLYNYIPILTPSRRNRSTLFAVKNWKTGHYISYLVRLVTPNYSILLYR